MQNIATIYTNICEGKSLAYIVFVLSVILLYIFRFINLNYFSSNLFSLFLRYIRMFVFSFAIFVILEKFFGLRYNIYSISLAFIIYLWAEYTSIWIRSVLYSKEATLPFSDLVETENCWRQGKKYYNFKEKIEEKGFKKIKSLKSKNRIFLATLFYREEDKILLMVIFRIRGNALHTSYYFVSKSKDKYIISTNDSFEETVFLPNNFTIKSSTLASFNLLLKKQLKLIKNSEIIDFENAADFLNVLYKENLYEALNKGYYLKDYKDGELLTQDGKFQYCKQVILKNYFN